MAAFIAKVYNKLVLSSSPQVLRGAILKVISGDTFIFVSVQRPDAVPQKIVLDKVMAPVKGQKYYEKSKKFAEKILLSKEGSLLVEITIKSVESDVFMVDLKYPKLVEGTVKYKDYQAIAVQRGMAFVKDRDDDVQLTEMENVAKAKKLGGWKSHHFIYPWNYHKKAKEIELAIKYFEE